MLIKAANRLSRRGQNVFATSGVSNHYLDVFALTGLDQIIRPFTDRNNAFASVGIPSAGLSGLPEPKEGECKDEDKLGSPVVDELRVGTAPAGGI